MLFLPDLSQFLQHNQLLRQKTKEGAFVIGTNARVVKEIN
jgi:hypothetical protein